MPRVKRGTTHVKKRRSLLKKTKGFGGGRKKLMREASTAATHAGKHAYIGRKLKKRTYRRLWQVRINAAVREHGLTYNKFINGLKKKNIDIDRKILAKIATDHPAVFKQLVEAAK